MLMTQAQKFEENLICFLLEILVNCSYLLLVHLMLPIFVVIFDFYQIFVPLFLSMKVSEIAIYERVWTIWTIRNRKIPVSEVCCKIEQQSCDYYWIGKYQCWVDCYCSQGRRFLSFFSKLPFIYLLKMFSRSCFPPCFSHLRIGIIRRMDVRSRCPCISRWRTLLHRWIW